VKHLEHILNRIVEEETFNDLYQVKNTWVEIDQSDRSKLEKKLWYLIDNAYKVFPKGHPRIKSPSDITNDLEMSFWRASDHDDDPHADMVVFGRKTPAGIKISGIGHDGEILSRKEVVRQCANLLRQQGFWVEASDNLARILLQLHKVPTVETPEKVEKTLYKPIKKWLGTVEGQPGYGWYIRDVEYMSNSYNWKDSLPGRRNYLTKILIGKPNV